MSSSSNSMSDSSSSDEISNEILQDYLQQEIQGYMFQPTRIVDDSSDSDYSFSSNSSTYSTRLENSDW